MAAIGGVLSVVGRCVYLGVGKDRILLLFATFETRWNRNTRSLIIGSKTIAVGEMAHFGGGMFEGPLPKLGWIQAPDSSCDASRSAIVYNEAL